ncbi:hypothetical protein P154DRAFT_423717 [Amniculicola lignicola CBS 123094]|uniref:Uncharacterized protein n=1 Tax=Amniculicola lignicola CBS 123094 TaxID=1392246 RepID=A0A6A5X1T6_9PLEO|nr:hypothetical protein P154DRAFT_423717 [Amniculicola lignicola CBS 123094]
MKLSIMIATLSAALTMAIPHTLNLPKVARNVTHVDGTVVTLTCIMCPCEGFTGRCTCVPYGCCC